MVLQLSIVIWIKDGVGWSCSKSPSSLPAPICSHKRVQVAHEESSKLVTDSPISPTSLLDFATPPQSLVWTLQFWTRAGMELRYLMPRFHWHWQCLCTETFQWISKWIKASIQFYLNGMCITVPIGTWKILKDDIYLYYLVVCKSRFPIPWPGFGRKFSMASRCTSGPCDASTKKKSKLVQSMNLSPFYEAIETNGSHD